MMRFRRDNDHYCVAWTVVRGFTPSHHSEGFRASRLVGAKAYLFLPLVWVICAHAPGNTVSWMPTSTLLVAPFRTHGYVGDVVGCPRHHDILQRNTRFSFPSTTATLCRMLQFIYRVSNLWLELGVSSVIVVGGCGDYFDVHDTAILVDNYIATDATERAHSVSTHLFYYTGCRRIYNIY